MGFDLHRLRQAGQVVAHHPTNFFLMMASVVGLIICFRLPPLTGTDEFTHFPRVYQITSGIAWEQPLPQQQYGGSLPLNVSNMVNDYRDSSRKSDPTDFAQRLHQLNTTYQAQRQVGQPTTAIFTSVAMYPPWAYWPSAIGLSLAKLLKTPLIWYVYAARLSTLLIWIGLTWGALKLLPSGKWFLVVLALLPTSLSQATTVGGDGLLTGLSWLMISLVLAVFAKKIKLTWLWLVAISTISLYLALIKVGYWLIAALPLVIPAYYFTSRRLALVWKSASLAIIIAASSWFALRTSAIASQAALTPRLGVNINSHLQEQYVLHHPLLFAARALAQIFMKSYDTVYLGVVGILTNRLIYLPILIIGLLYLALFLSLAQSQPAATLIPHRRRLLSVAAIVFLGTSFFISLAFYIGNTQVGSNVIFGIYGRYYLPILPLLLVIPLTRRQPTSPTRWALALPIISSVGLLYTIMAINR